jgi:HTH-type transcriptional regulator / antitoxin HigA
MTRRNGKMTITFNSERYRDLLIQYQPKLIKTEAENEEALAVVEMLMHRSDRSLEEDELYALLIALIEKFEQEHYSPASSSSPHSLMLFLMEQQQVEPADLVKVLGSAEIVAEIVKGDRSLNLLQAHALGNFFHVDPDLLIH